MRGTVTIISILLVFALAFTATAQDTSSPDETIANLKQQLMEIESIETESRIRLQELNEQLKPENIERAVAGIGSTHPEELREHRRKLLTIEREGTQTQLDLLEERRARIKDAIAAAELAAYWKSALPSPTPSPATSPSKPMTQLMMSPDFGVQHVPLRTLFGGAALVLAGILVLVRWTLGLEVKPVKLDGRDRIEDAEELSTTPGSHLEQFKVTAPSSQSLPALEEESATNGGGRGIFNSICQRVRRSDKKNLEPVIELAVEIAREGREGRRIGTLFTFGDAEAVLKHSRPLILDPLAGHTEEERQVRDANLRGTIKELAQLDGAFVVSDQGIVVSACRYLDAMASDVVLPYGMASRHLAGASISQVTDAVAIVVSESCMVRIFNRGKLVAEIIPELWLMDRYNVQVSKPYEEERVGDLAVLTAKA